MELDPHQVIAVTDGASAHSLPRSLRWVADGTCRTDAFASKHLSDMGEEVEDFTRFTWKLSDYRRMDKKTTSPEFTCGGHKWYVARDCVISCMSRLTRCDGVSQEYLAVPDGQLERASERHGVGLSQLRGPESERGMARVCPVLSRHLESERSDGLHPISHVSFSAMYTARSMHTS